MSAKVRALFRATFNDHAVFAKLVGVNATVFAFPALFDQAPQEAVAVRTKGGLKISGLVEVVFEFAFEGVIVGAEKIVLHFSSTNHAVFVGLEI